MSAAPGTGLTLVIGPANSGKMGRALDWWAGRLAARPVVVAPTIADAQALTGEMVRRAGALLGPPPAVTFDGLVRLILGGSPRYVTELERSILVARLLEEVPAPSRGLAPGLPGVAAAAGRLLEEWAESGRSPEEVSGVLERWGATESDAADLAADLRDLVGAYAGLCRELGLADHSGALQAAVAAAAGWTRPVVLYGFTSFTPGQRALVAALAGRAEVLLTLSRDRTRSVDLVTAAECAAWESLADQVEEATPRALAYSSPAIAHLERHFLDDSPPTPPFPAAWSGAEGVRFLLASGRRNEAELAAIQVAGLIRQGFVPGDIAVVVRQVSQWSRLLGDVFTSCGIPYRIDHRVALAESGLGHAFLSGVKGVAGDDPGAVLAYLRSPYSGLDPDQACDLELRYRRGREKGVQALAHWADGVCPGAMDFLWSAVHPGPTGASVDLEGAVVLAGRMLVEGLRVGGPAGDGAEADARAFRALASALQAARALGRSLAEREERRGGRAAAGRPAETPVSTPVLLGLLGRVPVPGDRDGGGDAVQILSIHRARARRFSAMIILGLTEGEFPGRSDPPSLLTPAQRARLDVLGDGLCPPRSDQEAALFLSAVSRAWQVLMLSARDAEDGGGDAAPSYFWLRAKELLGVGEDDHERRTLSDQVFSLDAAPSPRHYLRACAAAGWEPHPQAGLPSLPAAACRRSHPPTTLSSPAVVAELAQAACFSPSALESYLACPVRWFVEKVIGVEELETVVDERVVGQVVHKALGEIYQQLSAASLLPLRAMSAPEAERVALAVVERLAEGEECPGTVAERRLIACRLRQMIRTLFAMEVEAGGSLVLVDTEAEVGGQAGTDIGGLCIRGRVDRVDGAAAGDQIYVYDYKSGRIPKSSQFGTEEGLQLALYMMALSAERPSRTVAGGAYLSLKEGARSGVVVAGFEEALGPGFSGCRVLAPEALEEVLSGAREVALKAVEGMRAGLIGPRPDRRCAPWCRLGSICRSRRGGQRR
jgi:RecB family exonuclease